VTEEIEALEAGLLRAGEVVLLIDSKGREYLRQIRPRRFSFTGGWVDLGAL